MVDRYYANLNVEYQGLKGLRRVVMESDYDALEARCRELEADKQKWCLLSSHTKAAERIEALETALKDWIHQAGMFAHWSPARIKDAIKPYFASETKGDANGM